MTISTLTVVSFCIALLLTTVFPIVLILVLCLKKKISPIPMFVGVGAFFVSQIILRIPIMSALSTQPWYQNFAANNAVLFVILVGGLTAGLFEETARLGGAKLLKERTTYKDAVSFGLGHGFCEMILLNGMMNINNVVYSLLINSGNTELLVGVNIEQVTAALAAATPLAIGLGVFERLPAIAFHVFATLLVFKGVNERKISYYFYAILAHTILNSAAALVTQYWGIYAGEAALLVLGIAMLFYVIQAKHGFKTLSHSVVR